MEAGPLPSPLARVLLGGVLGASLAFRAEPASADPDLLPPPRAPVGFTIEKAAGDSAVVFPMFAAFDDRGRLFVAESSGLDLYAELQALTRKCRVRLLEDADGDGLFERSRVFAEGLVFPMGIAWRDGRLYVADPPDLVILEDRDGDGAADSRKPILGRFGHQDNGSLHGLVFGPDDFLYMTTGNPDGYRFELPGDRVIEGRSGALIRVRPDGSEPEVLSRGFENLVEIAFTPEGEIIGTDNWYQLPSGGVRDALVHLVDGGLYPRHTSDTGSPLPSTGTPLPPAALFPAVALSGLVLYRGNSFPEDMRGNLFSAQHNSRKVGRHVIRREGSTLLAGEEDFITSESPDFHPSDVLESADGSLLVIDTGGWYVQHCPTGLIRNSRAPGGIHRVRREGASPPADPWGLGAAWESLPAEGIAALLGDERPAVRERARRVLASRGEPAVAALEAVLRGKRAPRAMEGAVHALGSMACPSSLGVLRDALENPEPAVGILAARALGIRRDRRAEPGLLGLLSHTAPHVRRIAAEALARAGGKDSVPGLIRALTGDADAFLEHAIIHALHRVGGREDIEAALHHPHPRVQRAALVLLDQHPWRSLPRAEVFGRLSADDPALRRTALDILSAHAEWAGDAARLLGDLLERPALGAEEERSLRQLIPRFGADPGVARLLGKVLAGDERKVPEERRPLIVDSMAESAVSAVPDEWTRGLGALLGQGDGPARAAAVRALAVLGVSSLDEALGRIARDPGAPPDLRVEALRAVIARRPEIEPPLFDFILGRLSAEEPLPRLAALDVLSRSRPSEPQLLRILDAVRAEPLASPAALLPLLQRSAGEGTARAVAAYIGDSIAGGWRPRGEDLEPALKAVESAAAEAVAAIRLEAHGAPGRDEARLRDLEPLLSGGSPARGRAVFFGRKVACSTCHRVGAEGGPIGPDLTKVGAIRSGRDILESIVFPSSTLAQGYDAYAALAEGGTVVVGIIARQTPETLVLRASGGGEVQLRRSEVVALDRQSASLMPEGLERALSREELKDLLAFLQGLK